MSTEKIDGNDRLSRRSGVQKMAKKLKNRELRRIAKATERDGNDERVQDPKFNGYTS